MPFNLATVHDRIAKAIPDRTALIFRNRKFSYGELNERTNRFANLLMDIGVRTPQDRQTLPG
ncbi:MAG: AMP-binding protein, partial [Henriciella sp.]